MQNIDITVHITFPYANIRYKNDDIKCTYQEPREVFLARPHEIGWALGRGVASPVRSAVLPQRPDPAASRHGALHVRNGGVFVAKKKKGYGGYWRSNTRFALTMHKSTTYLSWKLFNNFEFGYLKFSQFCLESYQPDG